MAAEDISIGLEERWSRLFERLSPIYRWVPGGLR